MLPAHLHMICCQALRRVASTHATNACLCTDASHPVTLVFAMALKWASTHVPACTAAALCIPSMLLHAWMPQRRHKGPLSMNPTQHPGCSFLRRRYGGASFQNVLDTEHQEKQLAYTFQGISRLGLMFQQVGRALEWGRC